MSRNAYDRQSVRKPGYDYTSTGAYHIILRVDDRRTVLSTINGNDVVLTGLRVAWLQQEWLGTADHRPYVALDAFVIMPDHFHGIIWINRSVGARRAVPLHNPGKREFGKPQSGSLPTIVRAFKSAVTRRINIIRDNPGAKFWQRGYYDHIIRNDEELWATRTYIHQNPRLWREGVARGYVEMMG